MLCKAPLVLTQGLESVSPQAYTCSGTQRSPQIDTSSFRKSPGLSKPDEWNQEEKSISGLSLRMWVKLWNPAGSLGALSSHVEGLILREEVNGVARLWQSSCYVILGPAMKDSGLPDEREEVGGEETADPSPWRTALQGWAVHPHPSPLWSNLFWNIIISLGCWVESESFWHITQLSVWCLAQLACVFQDSNDCPGWHGKWGAISTLRMLDLKLL